ncbi:hypothetical protein N868_11210, partial [Cellulomonas carbonis T26]
RADRSHDGAAARSAPAQEAAARPEQGSVPGPRPAPQASGPRADVQPAPQDPTTQAPTAQDRPADAAVDRPAARGDAPEAPVRVGTAPDGVRYWVPDRPGAAPPVGKPFAVVTPSGPVRSLPSGPAAPADAPTRASGGAVPGAPAARASAPDAAGAGASPAAAS